MPKSVAFLSLLVFLAACSKEKPAPKKDQPSAQTPPKAMTVKASQKQLLFTYTDDKGAFRSVDNLEAVPAAARKTVIVTDLSLSPQERNAANYIQVADLTHKRPNGTFQVAVASRHAFEAKLAGTSSAAVAAKSQGVIVYSTSWCGVCNQAKKLLKQWKVPFVEKDIEASRKAQQELASKAAAQGIRPGGVPVIDVSGILLQGLDPDTLRQALKSKKLL